MKSQCARLAGILAILLAAIQLHAEEDAPKPKKEATVQAIAKQARPSIAVISVTGRDGKQRGIGTGFVIAPDGLVATNLHVIGEARPIKVQFADGKEYKVTEVRASDRLLDLAILKIDVKDLPPLKLGDSKQLEQGQPVVALGNPLGLKHSVVSGVVSGVREMEGRQMVQLAIPIEPGNSGGPLLDMDGKVHGILTMKSLVTENLGFAVAVNHLKPLVEKPNPVPMSRWLTIGQLDPKEWRPLLGANWQQRAGRILVEGQGKGFGGRSLCLFQGELPKLPFELAVAVKLDDESGAAGLTFHSDGDQRHYGFYPSNGRMRLTRFDGPTVFTWKVLQEVPTEHYHPGQWNHLKVRLEKDKISCFVNDQLVIESRDKGLTTGSVGLAKFRSTQADFKRFRVAKKVASLTPSDETIARVNKLLEKLPAAADVTAKDLSPLSKEVAASRAVLRQRSAQLERQAAEMRRLADDIHTNSITNRLARLAEQEDAKIDLAHAALLIAELDNHEVDVDGYLKEVRRMTDDIREALPDKADDDARLAALDDYLFQQNGFHGSRSDYYHRANSHMNRVIDDREGLPITLSVLYMELGRSLGLSIEGVGLPGHFVVRYVPKKGEPQLIDVFDGGTKMSRDDAAQRVKEITGRDLEDEYLAAADKKSIIVRMLRNLFGLAEAAQDREAMLRYLDAMVAVDPQLLPQRGMRAVIRFQTGRHRAALTDLDWFLENEPEGVELDRIREMRRQFQERMGKGS